MTTTTAGAPSKGMNIGLWVAQALLALAFLGAGLMKMTQPLEQLAEKMTWVPHVPPMLVRFIGTSEVAGALGLLLPAATRIKPVLTPVAASLLVVVMVLGAGTHVLMGEPGHMPPSLVLGALAAFVAWGRFTKAPIAPKGA